MTATHRVSSEGGTCVVSLLGEIDISNTEKVQGWIRSAVDSAGCEALKLDLAQLSFLDSAGVRMILEVHDYVIGKGMTVTAVDPQPVVHQVLSLTGVAPVLGLPNAL